MDDNLSSSTGLILMFVLGLRHGLDPDHIACIDGLTWRALNHEQRHAPWIGTLFAIGHGLLVTAIAVGVGQIAHTVSVPETVVSVFNWVPTALLLLVGTLNLRLLLAAPQNFQPTGWKLRLIPQRLRNHSSPWAVIVIGVLFATVFDTATQASAWGYVASNKGGGLVAALAAGLVFTFGMVITDTLNGRLICHVSRSSNAALVGPRYRLILGWLIVAMSFGIAGYNILSELLTEVELDDRAFSTTGAGLIVVMVLLSVWLHHVHMKAIGKLVRAPAVIRSDAGTDPARREPLRSQIHSEREEIDMKHNSENVTQSQPHSVHIIGIGRTGAAYVEALIRSGEIEDSLAEQGSSFAALLLDIGEDDMFVPGDYARSLKKRLATRGIPAERYNYESFAFEMPDAATFAKDLEAARASFKAANGHDLITKLPEGFEFPKPGQHTPRAIAKALAAIQTHLGVKPVDAALQRLATQVRKSAHPSTVLVVFGLAGGTGSGMAADLARALKKMLPANAQVAGVGQLSHSGDGDYHNSLAQTMALEEIDAAVRGDVASNPFPGGFFVVSSEHSWQRLTAYTSTGVKEVRQRFKQMVTNRFVADSFMRWVMADGSAHLVPTLQRGGRKCILFDVAKLTHPGVQVLPGESASSWDAVLQQWISFTPKFSGLIDGFKTDYAEVHVYAARDMKIDMIEANLKKVIESAYLKGSNPDVTTFRTEFFDALTAYANVILPGATKDDLVAYKDAKATQSEIGAAAKALEVA